MWCLLLGFLNWLVHCINKTWSKVCIFIDSSHNFQPAHYTAIRYEHMYAMKKAMEEKMAEHKAELDSLPPQDRDKVNDELCFKHQLQCQAKQGLFLGVRTRKC